MTSFFDLSGDIGLVVGGAGLIGPAITKALSDQGATVVVADVNETAGQSLKDEFDGVRFVHTDATDESDVPSLIEGLVQDFGSLDTIVNCSWPKDENYGEAPEDVGFDAWREHVDLHLNSYFLVTNLAADFMRDQETDGTIINFGSTYGIQAPNFSIYEGTDMVSPPGYATIKPGILNMTRYFASYLGEENVRVRRQSGWRPRGLASRYVGRELRTQHAIG